MVPITVIARDESCGAIPPPIAPPSLRIAGFIKINVFALGSLPIKVVEFPVKIVGSLYTLGKNVVLLLS